MPDIPPAVSRLLEDPQIEGPLWPGSEVVHLEGLSVWFGPPYYPGLTVVQRIRLGDVDRAVRDVREIASAHGSDRVTWFVGSSATPIDLAARLCAHGMVLDDDPVLSGVVLAQPPDGVPDDVVVRPVESFDDFERFYRIQQSAFEIDEQRTDEGAGFLRETYDTDAAAPYVTTYLAYLDDEPVATARATFGEHGVVLNGGSTLHRARGRGVYRALVAARYNDAVERGVPFLTTLARPTSDPILQRMGFVQICEVQVLVDEF